MQWITLQVVQSGIHNEFTNNELCLQWSGKSIKHPVDGSPCGQGLWLIHNHLSTSAYVTNMSTTPAASWWKWVFFDWLDRSLSLSGFYVVVQTLWITSCVAFSPWHKFIHWLFPCSSVGSWNGGVIPLITSVMLLVSSVPWDSELCREEKVLATCSSLIIVLYSFFVPVFLWFCDQ